LGRFSVQQMTSGPTRLRRVTYSILLGLMLLAVTLFGIETVASALVPPWPARALRPTEPMVTPTVRKMPFAPYPWFAEPYNDWGMRDRPRTITKAIGAFRAVVIGDSFVESAFTPLSLPAAVEQAAGSRLGTFEAVNLGVSGTGPRSYYFRLRDVALALSPDAILVVFYAGNDFIEPGDGYSAWPRLIDESPGGSLLGWMMPRTNWLLINRLRLAEVFPKNRIGPPGEEEMLFDAISKPPESEGLARLVAHLHKYRFPDLTTAQISEIVGRGDQRLLRVAARQTAEPEFMLPWMVDTLVANTVANYDVPANRAEAARMAAQQDKAAATATWLQAMSRVAARRSLPLIIFLAPVGTVDPEYGDFWKPWIRYYSWNLLCDEWHRHLAALLPGTGVKFVDLRLELTGVRGTYRKLDGHWTKKGEAIVADRIAQELISLKK
jgi:hypothetical protein